MNRYFFCTFVLVASFVFIPPTLVSAEPNREDKLLSKKIEKIFREVQHRRGTALDARLTELWQSVLSSDPEIEKYARENPRRRGALIYVRASGEPGEKTVRVFFQNSTEATLDGKLYKSIKEWVLPNPIAQSAARQLASKLSSSPDVNYLATAECSEQKAEVVLSPKTTPALRTPLQGESVYSK